MHSENRPGLLRRLVTTFSIWNRTRKATVIREFMDNHQVNNLLLVGALPLRSNLANEGIVEQLVRQGRQVRMGINIETPAGEFDYPFMVADARDMPFPNDYVDFALSNAIIEHVGNKEDQHRFVLEHIRVARAWAITTPNRWFPVEPHTAVTFRHWSSKWRAKQDARVFTRLLSRRELLELLPSGTIVKGGWWSPTFTALYARSTGSSHAL